MGRLHHDADDQGIHTIRFDNPPAGFLDGAMTVELEALLARLAADPAVRVLVLTGVQPDVFIRHFDLVELSQVAEALAAVGGGDVHAAWHSSIFHRITRLLETMPAVVIAALNGHCMGVGFELALACDLRIAGEGDCSIGLPEMHIAMLPGGGGTARLARLLGPARAMELICTATTVAPRDALARGLVNRVVADPLGHALGLARHIATLSPGGIAAAKRVIRGSVDVGIEAALTLEQREVNARLGSAEVRAVLAAYAALGADLRHPLPPG